MTYTAHRLQSCLNIKIRISFTYLRFSHPRSGLLRQTIDCKASREDTQEKPEGCGQWLKGAPGQTVTCLLLLVLRFVCTWPPRTGWEMVSRLMRAHIWKAQGKTSWGSLKRDYRILTGGEPLKRALTASLRLCPCRVTLHSNTGICLIVHLRLVNKTLQALSQS